MRKVEIWKYVDRLTNIAFDHGRQLGQLSSSVNLDILQKSQLSNSNIIEDITQFFVEGLIEGARISDERVGDNILRIAIELFLEEDINNSEKQEAIGELFKHVKAERPIKVRKLKRRNSSNMERSIPALLRNGGIQIEDKLNDPSPKPSRYYSYGLVFGNFRR